MHEYHQSKTIQVSADKVFSFVSDIKNLPKYLPTVTGARPQQGERIRIQGEAAGHHYDSDGYFRVDDANRRLEWGSDGENNYSGWLEVREGNNQSSSELTVHLNFDPKPELAREFEKQGGNRHEVINRGIQEALTSIQNLCEGKGGKVESARQGTRK
ncbi:MAG TPA: SRPBCC family protein [Blastocatellia bacterium]|nr:SRPBCC family protein [Blastocatellia bacterium]HMV82683.1 SRPBCC family protein [Blastocatellia bacterium]HMX24482.1 SRPBCC family protein [Blastocatellia bacterium]HMY76437.1 SRPBCC family protein [Blastocatellia bacterium]HMZ16800.1 SRPBCC family protein [Blastocatellia bacterium]